MKKECHTNEQTIKIFILTISTLIRINILKTQTIGYIHQFPNYIHNKMTPYIIVENISITFMSNIIEGTKISVLTTEPHIIITIS